MPPTDLPFATLIGDGAPPRPWTEDELQHDVPWLSPPGAAVPAREPTARDLEVFVARLGVTPLVLATGGRAPSYTMARLLRVAVMRLSEGASTYATAVAKIWACAATPDERMRFLVSFGIGDCETGWHDPQFLAEVAATMRTLRPEWFVPFATIQRILLRLHRRVSADCWVDTLVATSACFGASDAETHRWFAEVVRQALEVPDWPLSPAGWQRLLEHPSAVWRQMALTHVPAAFAPPSSAPGR